MTDTEPEERVLDRLYEEDWRSLNYRVPLTARELEKPQSKLWPLGVWLDQGTQGACFPAGTMIRLVDGSHRRIEEIRTLDRVVTAEGRTGLVVQTSVRRADELVSVRLRGHMAVRCTPEHPFLTQRGYVPAAQITRDDRVAVTRWRANGPDVIEVPVDPKMVTGTISGIVNTGGVVSEVAPLPSLLGRTPSLGRLIGLYAAEGHVTPNKVVWSFGGHEEYTLVAETVDLIKTCFDAVARVQKRPSGAINVVLYGKAWMRLFAALVPGTAKHGTKRLSPHVSNGPSLFLNGVLEGWLDGDGHRSHNNWGGVTVSKQLGLDMHGIANGLGLMPRIRASAPSVNRHAATRQHRYDLAIPQGDGTNRQPMDDHAIWRRVTSVEHENFDGWVYNMHVEGDESYVADGLGVHNCVLFGCAHEAAAEPEVWPVSDALARDMYRETQLNDEFAGQEPEMSGTSVLAGAKTMVRRGFWSGYTWSLDMPDLIGTVGYKRPVVAGTDWWTGMDRLDANGFIWPTGSIRGGHAYLIVGQVVVFDANGNVDYGRSYFIIHNSWSASWGQNGRAKITFASMANLMAANGDFCVAVSNAPAPPQPPEEKDMSDPGICIDSKGRRWVFGRGGDNACWAKVENGGWFSLGGILTSGVAAAAGGNRIRIVVKGTDNAYHEKIHDDVNDPKIGWSGWNNLGGTFLAPPPTLIRRIAARFKPPQGMPEPPEPNE